MADGAQARRAREEQTKTAAARKADDLFRLEERAKTYLPGRDRRPALARALAERLLHHGGRPATFQESRSLAGVFRAALGRPLEASSGDHLEGVARRGEQGVPSASSEDHGTFKTWYEEKFDEMRKELDAIWQMHSPKTGDAGVVLMKTRDYLGVLRLELCEEQKEAAAKLGASEADTSRRTRKRSSSAAQLDEQARPRTKKG